MRRAESHPGARRLGTALLLLSLAACSLDPDGGRQGDYTRFAAFQTAREIEIGAEAGWAHEAALRLAARLEVQLGLPARVVRLEAARPSPRRLRMLIGTPQAHGMERVIASLASTDADLGELLSGSDARGSALIATLPDPLRPDSPLTVCLARPGSELRDPGLDLDLAACLEPVWRSGWQRFAGSAIVAASHDGAQPERAGAPALQDLADWADAPELWSGLPAQLEQLLGAPLQPPQLPRLRVWEQPVDLARAAGGFAAFVPRPASGLLELTRTCAPAELRRGLVEQLARAGWGEPHEAWLAEGLGVHLADSWWGTPLGLWCARLAREELVLDIDSLCGDPRGDPRGDLSADGEASPHQLGPLRGLLVGVLVETRGAQGLRRAWEQGLVLDAALREAFEARLQELDQRHAAVLLKARRGQLGAVLSRPFRHGANLVAAGPDPARASAGFGSRGAAQRMTRLAELGADAVAFDWAVALTPSAPLLAYGRRCLRGAQADDRALAEGARAAREQGLDLLLKPHLWISDSGTYASWTLRYTPEDWRRSFEAQRRLVLHYGLLAELIGAEVLSLGSEQRAASQTNLVVGASGWSLEHIEWKRARWSELIATARAAFDGGLTYAAHWDGERDGIAFWDELDFVGLDLFAPLAPDSLAPGAPFDFGAARAGLWYSLSRAQADAARQGKRLLVCEVGFPATQGDWAHPEQPRGPPDLIAQAELLRALAVALSPWQANPDALAGLFLWNQTCAPPQGESGSRAYDLGEPKIERILRRIFALP